MGTRIAEPVLRLSGAKLAETRGPRNLPSGILITGNRKQGLFLLNRKRFVGRITIYDAVNAQAAIYLSKRSFPNRIYKNNLLAFAASHQTDWISNSKGDSVESPTLGTATTLLS